MSLFSDMLSGAALDSSPLAASPNTGSNKRTRPDDDSDDSPTPSQSTGRNSTQNSSGLGLLVPTRLFSDTSANIITFAKQHMAGKRLKISQTNEVLDFIKHPLDERFVMLYVALIQSRDREDERSRELASWEPSNSAEVNLLTFARHIILSPKLRGYKADVAGNYLWTIIRTLRWDIPDEVFKNPAAYAKLDERIRYHLTQQRASLKKKIKASIDTREGHSNQTIFALAQTVTQGTHVNITVQLCARLALLRSEYVDGPDPKYYDRLDMRLAEVRKTLDTSRKVNKFFRAVLDKDLLIHGGLDGPSIEDLVPKTTPSETELQVEQTIDGANDAGVPLPVVSSAATGTPGVAAGTPGVAAGTAGEGEIEA